MLNNMMTLNEIQDKIKRDYYFYFIKKNKYLKGGVLFG
jgi:hypothetical protein